jgi:type I restriction enzyme S subunit
MIMDSHEGTKSPRIEEFGRRLKYVCRLGYGDSLPKYDEFSGDIPVFGSNGQYSTTSVRNTSAPAIVLGRKGSYGKVNWASEGCFASDTTFYIDSNQSASNLRWLYWALQTLKLDEGSQEATVPGLNRESVYEQRVLYPDNKTQHLIADYLDRETARIDALVVEKEKMLALLEEKRAALISRAVTRGLDPTAPLKPSGLDWLGDIPAHWEVVRLKFFSFIGYGLSQPPEYQASGTPFVRATNVNRGSLSTDGLVYVDESDLPPERTVRLNDGDLIVVRSGAYTGDSALVTYEWEGSVLGFDMIVRLQRFCHPIFVSFALLSQYVLNAQINPLRLRAAQPHLNAEELGGVFFAVPPLDEQEMICNYIITERDQIINAEKQLKHSIDLLKERRAALITAAVTGQIPVEEMRS